MTAMPEAKLAREAEMCFCTISLVTDYDCWHDAHEAVTAHAVAEVMKQNSIHAQNLLRGVIPILGSFHVNCERGCNTALEGAVMTAPEMYDAHLVSRLDAIGKRFFARQHAREEKGS